MVTLGKCNENLRIAVCAVAPRVAEYPKLSFPELLNQSLGILHSKNPPSSSQKHNCEQIPLSGGTLCLPLPGLAFPMTFSDSVLIHFVPVPGMCTSTMLVVQVYHMDSQLIPVFVSGWL